MSFLFPTYANCFNEHADGFSFSLFAPRLDTEGYTSSDRSLEISDSGMEQVPLLTSFYACGWSSMHSFAFQLFRRWKGL